MDQRIVGIVLLGLVAATSVGPAAASDSGVPAAAVPGVTAGALATNGQIVYPDGEQRVGPWSPDDRASFSPDGSAIAYPFYRILEGPDDVSLRVLDAGGQSREVWSDVGRHLHQPVWSPDGTQIAVATMPFGIDGGPAKVWLVDAEGGAEPTLLLDGRRGEFAQLAWSPDGGSLYYTRYDRDVFRYDLETAGFHQVTHWCAWDKVESPGPFPNCEVNAAVGSLSLSPDGQHLAATVSRRVVVINTSDGIIVRTLADLGRLEFAVGVAWSPEGDEVAYGRYWYRGGKLATEIVPATGGPARVAAKSAVTSWQPCPDGECPVLGEPRGDASVTATPQVRAADISVAGRIRPRPAYLAGRERVTVVLQKRLRGRWTVVSRKTPPLDSTFRYSTKIRRPDAARCRVVVRYPGGWYLTGARTIRRFSC